MIKTIFTIMVILWLVRWSFDNILLPPINWVRENILGKDPLSRIKPLKKNRH